MTTERSGMSLQDVYDKLRAAENGANGPTLWPGECGDMADAIDAHLSRDAVVSDEDVGFEEVVCEVIGHVKDGEDGPYIEWLPEGGIHDLPPGVPIFALEGNFELDEGWASLYALSSLAARHAAVPDGYVLAPVEPTEAMRLAANKATMSSRLPRSTINAVYKAMLAQRDGGNHG